MLFKGLKILIYYYKVTGNMFFGHNGLNGRTSTPIKWLQFAINLLYILVFGYQSVKDIKQCVHNDHMDASKFKLIHILQIVGVVGYSSQTFIISAFVWIRGQKIID